VLDLAKQDYRTSAGEIAEEVAAILKIKNPAEKFAALRASSHPQANSCGRSSATSSITLRCNWKTSPTMPAISISRMRWGFGWAQGPFETWQAAGWADTAQAIAADIAAGKAMSDAAAGLGAGKGRTGVHSAAGFLLGQQECLCAALDAAGLSAPALPRARARRNAATPEKSGETLYENDGVRLWRCLRSTPESASFPSSRRCTPSATKCSTACCRRAPGRADGLMAW
jgi:3-hydroxyacyl-CoA dehydrogenase